MNNAASAIDQSRPKTKTKKHLGAQNKAFLAKVPDLKSRKHCCYLVPQILRSQKKRPTKSQMADAKYLDYSQQELCGDDPCTAATVFALYMRIPSR